MPVGKNIIRVSTIGYITTTINADLLEFTENKITVKLKISNQSIDEVVVMTGYGSVKKKSYTGSVSTISSKDIRDYTNTSEELNGRLAGVSANFNEGNPGSDVTIRIRGMSSITSGIEPLYIIDGLVVETGLNNIDIQDIQSMDVLKDAAATSLYGSRAANGVIVITTKRKTKRTDFKDYAIWQPELNTNKSGKAGFSITYPDNINGWNTYVLAMDRKHRTGKGFKFIKSYKPLSAELALPSFLIQGDSVELVGKAFNHSAETYNAKTIFSATNNHQKITDTILKSSSSCIDKYNVKANNKDSVVVNFSLTTTTGFKDEEQRKIAVLQQGLEETDGKFEVLANDTTIEFERKDTTTPFTINIEADALQVLLNETENIKKYPYYCMEQTASKLKGMLLQKQIKKIFEPTF